MPRGRRRRVSERPLSPVPERDQNSTGDILPKTPALSQPPRKRRHDRSPSAHSDDEHLPSSVGVEPVVEVDAAAPQAKRARLAHGIATPPSTAPRKPSGLTPALQRAVLSPSTPEALTKKVQFQPLEETLGERTRRRLKRRHLSETVNEIEDHKREDARKDKMLKALEEKISTLEEELEERRLAGIELNDEDNAKDTLIKELRMEVEQLRRQSVATDLSVDLAMNGSDSDADWKPDLAVTAPEDGPDAERDVAPVVNPTMIEITSRETTAYSSFATRATPRLSSSPVQDPTCEAEVRGLEQEIHRINVARAELESTLQTFTIALQSLGFTEADAPPDAIVSALRAAFHQAREDVNDYLPDRNPNRLNNAEFLKLLTDFIRDQATLLENYLASIRMFEEENMVLKGRYNQTVTQLEESEHRAKALQEKWHNMDLELDDKEKTIVELQEAKSSLKATLEEQTGLQMQQAQRIRDFELESEEQALAINRLKKAVDSYHSDLTKAQELFDRVENEHAAAIAEIKKSNSEVIQGLESTISRETALREALQRDLTDRINHISQLQLELEVAREQLLKVQDQLSQSQNYGDSEHQEKLDAEAMLEDRNKFITALEERVRTLESSTEQLAGEISQIRDQLKTQRRQREDAEAELDQRNGEIADLSLKLKDAAVQANELRSKLFAKQQEHERALTSAEHDAAVREEQFQADMGTQISRRDAAEKLAAERETIIADLERKIRLMDQDMDCIRSAKAALEVDLKARNAELESSLEKANTAYERTLQKKEKEIGSLHHDIAHVTDTLGKCTELAEKLQQENRAITQQRQEEAELYAKQVAGLEGALGNARTRISELESQKTSLEKRVNDEAVHMLEVSNDLRSQLDTAQRVVQSKAKQILELEQKAFSMSQAHSIAIEEKNREIENLEIIGQVRLDDNRKLVEQVCRLRQILQNRTAGHEQTIRSIQQTYREATAKGDQLVNDSLAADRAALNEVEAMEDVRAHGNELEKIIIRSNSVEELNGQESRKVKSSRKKSRAAVRDSGIMMPSSDNNNGDI